MPLANRFPMVNDLVVPTGFRRLWLSAFGCQLSASSSVSRTTTIQRQSFFDSQSVHRRLACAQVCFATFTLMTNPPAPHESAALDLSVTISPGSHLIPSRTQKLSLGCR